MLRVLIAAIGLSWMALPALAGPLPVPPAPAGEVRPDQEVVTELSSLPAGAREFELFLLPEDGTRRLIRLSAECDVREQGVLWRMPKIEARTARLVLRVGRQEAEWESEPSAAFAVAPLGGQELARVREGRSEAGYPMKATPLRRTSTFGDAPRRAEISAGGELAGGAETSSAPLVGTPRSAHVARATTCEHGAEFTAPTTSAPAPAFIPLRN